MARVLRFPFGLWPNGQVATVEQETAEADEQEVAVIALTRLGERVLVPGFGITDPLFGGFPTTELAAAVAAWGPPITINTIAVVDTTDDTQTIEVTYE